ncbi:hypothetical protein AB4059_06435 [Lysobacter sp. 2RAF19]
MPPRRHAAFVVLLALCGCVSRGEALGTGNAPPQMLVGDFVDDYGITYRISAQDWHQRPGTHYRVVAWHPDARYLVAQNDAGNASDAGLWTRIDWVALPGMPPYAWGFCLSAYNAPTQADAERTTVARRDAPKTGCNGFPFSRMRRVGAGGD